MIENVTPLQAAILSGDTELFELIKNMLSTADSLAEFEFQRVEIYAPRLTAFYNQTRFLVDQLEALLESGVKQDAQFGRPITPEYIAKLRSQCDVYEQAINSNDFETIFNGHEAAQQNAAKDLLDSIFEAINDATADEVASALSTKGASWQETDEAHAKSWATLTLTEKINRFRNILKTSVSNAESLLQVAFDGRADMQHFDWSNPECYKQSLCCRQVIGSIQACLSARTAHAFSYSLSNIIQYKHSCPRSLNLRLNKSKSFYHPRLGFDFAIYEGYENFGSRGTLLGMRKCWIITFNAYMAQKQEAFRTYCKPSHPQDVSISSYV